MSLPAVSFGQIVLARHGETDYNLHGRFQGWLPVPLNDRGRAQATELGERAATQGFEELWSSPLTRARETADIVGRRLGLEPREDARLAETDAGDWTDRPFAEVQAQDPARFEAFVAGDPDFAFPGGESYRTQAERVMAALRDIAQIQRRALIVCHGVVIRLALDRLGLRRLGASTPEAAVENGSLVALEPGAW